ncbi:VPLPA-CTERM sorting domain-containing protein [Roseovarius sp. ZX-A-9]|uniref:VPLPA-CTERM sorting domain-containing protein n=1 Tax=Roseovarius sp. ZX-A-9 TaxID=3014783 RepID=UPI00232BF721|nr:VPLPA-CTERM sorting domain-containing protein [Roseovarius sp. ZX-A-9]
MNMKLSLTFAAIATLVAPAAMASTIVVDDFSAAGSVAAITDGNPATTDVVDAGILGGNRFMWVSTDNGAAPFGTTFSAFGGDLYFGNDSSVQGQAVLVYDGGGAGSAFSFTFDSSPANMIDVDTDGLGGGAGIDFLAGNPAANRALSFSGSDFDTLPSTATFRAYAWDVDGTLVEYDEVIGGPDFDSNLGLTAFSTTGGGDGVFDWTKVGALAFSIESNANNFDGKLGAISVVPLPASALLLLGGLGGLTAASRRRRKDRKA